MRRRRRLRRRFLWAGLLMGIVLLYLTVSILRAGLWARGAVGDGVRWRNHERGQRYSAALS
jgi:hypothetical protein